MERIHLGAIVASTRPPANSMREDVRAAVTPRAFALVVGVLLLQLGFILSYVAAFHAPNPQHVPLAVVAPAGAPAGAAENASAQLNAIPGNPVRAQAISDAAAATTQLRHRDVDGVLLLGPTDTDQLVVAGAEGGALAQALQEVITRADTPQHRTLTVTDAVPAGSGDARGLTSFYLAVGWVVGGYLVASILAISAGGRPPNRRRAAIRVAALAAYAVASGIGGAVIVGPVLGALSGHSWAIAGLGGLLVLGVGAFTMAIQALTGVVGIGLAVLLFVVLGNPSAGGAYPAPLLPPFWRDIGPWLPPGAGTSAIRSIVYFSGTGVLQPILVSLAYAAAGILVLILAAGRRQDSDPATRNSARPIGGRHEKLASPDNPHYRGRADGPRHRQPSVAVFGRRSGRYAADTR